MTAPMANRMCSGKRSTRRPTVICATAPHRNTAVVRPPTMTQRDAVADALVDDLRQRDRHGVEDQAGAERDHDEQAEDHRRGRLGQRDVGRGAALGRVRALSSGTSQIIDDAGRDADHARHQESAAPGERRGQRRGDAGGERHAEIAADAVERHGAAALGGVFQNHRGADRMIDRGEHAEREQRDASTNSDGANAAPMSDSPQPT